MVLEQERIAIAKKVCSILNQERKECYLVGGAVRDRLLGNKMGDIDIATNAHPEQVMKIFSEHGFKTIPTGIKYGTVTVIADNEPIEITTYRKDIGYSDLRHPDEVRYSETIKEDLERRDFTINSIALNPLTDEYIDLFNGINDINNGIIKAVGDPNERFQEDPLRMFRSCRFLSKLGEPFRLEKRTQQALQTNKNLARFLSVERIRDEILKTLPGKNVKDGIKCMSENGLFDYILPEFNNLRGLEQPPEYHKKDAYEHTLDVIDYLPKEKPLLRLAGMFHDIGKPETKSIDESGRIRFYNHEKVGSVLFNEIGKRLKLSNDAIEYVSNLIRNHLIHYDESWTDGAVRRFVNRVGKENVPDILLLNEADFAGKVGKSTAKKLGERIKSMELKGKSIETPKLAITGHDIMRVLNKPGSPLIGKILSDLHELITDNPELNERDVLLSKLEKYRDTH